MSERELNLDGLVGPTHNYAGLARGNLASARNAGLVANPREAALQGLEKMWMLAELGVPQAVMPPQERPWLPLLEAVGFRGDEAAVLHRAARKAPRLLAAAWSASAMWTANAATVSASADSGDGRVHFMPANLVSQLHRSIEPPSTATLLRALFPEGDHFTHHPPLPATPGLGDEGAANHTRLQQASGTPGVSVFVYGSDGGEGPRRFPARQRLAASEAVARLHGLEEGGTVYARQDPTAVDAGVFHNDVIAVGHGRLLFAHERAFADRDRLLAALRPRLPDLEYLEVPQAVVPLEDAVASYLFNSQVVTSPDGATVLILPEECRQVGSVAAYLEGLQGQGRPFDRLVFRDLRESMRNGGGPACLRLRVPLTGAERSAMAPGVILDEVLYRDLREWVRRWYRDRLAPGDLADPALAEASRGALDELTRRLGIGSVYRFQHAGA
ncbi:N-succinylarginine dihydrolase [Arhodomonas sp. SL1]|uniref:N-succinylarginine dihydrolase n=1 Tax=Arhodomonas sp. SL1 TaxID=3425691 RepID=UPI003F883C41